MLRCLLLYRYGAESGVPPPAEWTEGVAAHLRAHGAQQLIMDGAQFTSASLPLAGIDLVGRTCAAPPAAAAPPHPRAALLTAGFARPPQVLQPASVGARERPSARRDAERAGGPQPKLFVVKEFGLVSPSLPTPTTTGRRRAADGFGG